MLQWPPQKTPKKILIWHFTNSFMPFQAENCKTSLDAQNDPSETCGKVYLDFRAKIILDKKEIFFKTSYFFKVVSTMYQTKQDGFLRWMKCLLESYGSADSKREFLDDMNTSGIRAKILLRWLRTSLLLHFRWKNCVKSPTLIRPDIKMEQSVIVSAMNISIFGIIWSSLDFPFCSSESFPTFLVASFLR